jgi:transcription elongation factor Elf1
MAGKKLAPVWRKIVIKNEKQNGKLFDVLVCNHAQPVSESTKANTYRRYRQCPECTEKVRSFRDQLAAA